MKQRIIGVISGKGGVGKTTCTVNLSSALSNMSQNVIAVDADVKMSGLGLQLGMYDFRKTLNDLLTGRGNIYEAIHTHSSGLKIIPSSLSLADTSMFGIREVFQHPFLQENLILVDSPPGLEKSTIEIIGACSETIIVTTPETPSVINAMKILSKSIELGVRPLGILVNMYNKNDPNQITPKEIESVCEQPVIGVIPQDKSIRKSIFKKLPAVALNPYSPASVEFKKIASKLVNQEYRPEKFLALKRMVWGLKK